MSVKKMEASESTYHNVIGEQSLAIRLREGNRVFHFGALGVRAEMAVANGGKTNGVVI